MTTASACMYPHYCIPLRGWRIVTMRCDDEAGRLPINDKIPVHFQDFIGQVWFKILDVNALFKQMHLAFAVNSRVGIEHSDDDSGNFPLSQSLGAGDFILAPLEARF